MTSFIYVCIYTVEIHCINCKGIKTNKNIKKMKNNATAFKGLKMFTLWHMSLRSESEAKSLLSKLCFSLKM